MNPTPHGSRRTRRVRRDGPIRTILATTGIFAVATIAALVGTGTSYALWNGTAVVNASSVSSGSTNITVNGVQNYTISGMDLSLMGPGQSVVAPLRMANTGTTPLAVTVASGGIVAQTNALADQLIVTVTPAAVCTPGLTGGVSGRLASFTTAASPLVVPAGTAVPMCLEVRMDPAAPASVQGGTATFAAIVDAVQVR